MSVQPIPEGFHTITPYFTVKDARAFIDFLKKAFQAEEIETIVGEDGVVTNSEVRIGTSMLMTGDARDRAPWSAMLYLYVADPDKLYTQAMAAGAKSVRAMADQAYGDRCGAVEDAWGNQWWLAKRLR